MGKNIQKLPLITNKHDIPREIDLLGVKDTMTFEEENVIRRRNLINWSKAQYEEMGIKVIDEYDDLFFNVELPKDWEIKPTEHYLWNDVVDNHGRKRISFFYKSAFYDRDAFSNFERRFKISYEIPDYDVADFEEKPKMIPTGETKTIFIDDDGNELEDLQVAGGDGFYMEDCYGHYYDGSYLSPKRKAIKTIQKQVYKENPDWRPISNYDKYSQPFHYEVYDFDKTLLFSSNIVKTDYEYTEERHREFFDHRDAIQKKAIQQCRDWLTANYPNWESPFLYWEN